MEKLILQCIAAALLGIVGVANVVKWKTISKTKRFFSILILIGVVLICWDLVMQQMKKNSKLAQKEFVQKIQANYTMRKMPRIALYAGLHEIFHQPAAEPEMEKITG